MLPLLLAGAVVVANLASASGDGVLHVPLTKSGISKRLERRDAHDTVPVDLMEKRNQVYAASLEIGSNSQNVTVLLDTGSGDLVVISPQNPYCHSITDNDPFFDIGWNVCYESSMFDSDASSTFSKNDTDFHIMYARNFDQAYGNYGQDDVKFGGLTIKNANFVVANNTSMPAAVWGIGFPGSGAAPTKNNFSKVATYSNLPMQLKEQGHIKSVAYSLWLNDKDEKTGSLLFGGVDHSKYNGTLQTVPLLSSKPGDKPNEFRIKLDGITMYQGDRTLKLTKRSYAALLDSAEPFTKFPDVLRGELTDSFNHSCVPTACYTSCGYEGSLTFDFSGVEIDVPFSEILESGWDLPGSGVDCRLPWEAGIPYGGDDIILGESFLRSAYVVYDLEHYEIALAQRDFNGGSGSVEAISAGIPEAVKAPRYSDTSLASTAPRAMSSSTQTATIASGSSTNAAESSGSAASRTTESSKQGTTASAAASPSTADSSSTSSSASASSSSASASSSSASASSSSSASSTSSTSSKAESNAASQRGASSLFSGFYAGIMGLFFYI